MPTQILDRLDTPGLRMAWDRLAGDSPIQGYAWAKAASETLIGHGEELVVVTVGPKHAPTAIAPLVRAQGFGEHFELLGVSALNEPMDVLGADESALTELGAALCELGLPLLFKRMPLESAAADVLTAAFSQSGVVLSQTAPSYPWVALDARWCEPESHLTARRRSDLRRASRHASAMGEVRTEILAPTIDALPPLLEEALRVESSGWKGRSGSAIARDARRGPFYVNYAYEAARAGTLRIALMRIGGQAVAMELAVVQGGRFWLLKMGYDESFARCSPGTLLLRETLRYAAEAGLRSFELLGHVEPWTELWTEETRDTVSLRAYPARVSSAAGLAQAAAGFVWPRLRSFLGASR